MIKMIRKNMPIRAKLSAVFLLSTAIIFCVNLYIFTGINSMMEKVDNSYYSNAELMELESTLESLRVNLREYLSTKSSDSMENFYDSQDEYRKLVEKLNEKVYGNSSSIMEKDIRNMSENYLLLASKAVDAKRGRNIEEYTQYYRESEAIYEFIYTYIYSLNTAQFQSNTVHYEKLMGSLGYAETVSIVIMVMVAFLNMSMLYILTANIIDPLESLLTSARLKYLQAQINPHFLFNTLNAGAQLAMMESADRTYTYIQNVADFFRYNLKNDNNISTIGDEIDLVDNYMFILNVRFSNELIYEKDIDESLLGVQIPSMILQPIIENAVNHGLRDVAHDKKIRLTVTKEDDNILIIVSDNGVGMSQVQIDAIMSGHAMHSGQERDSNGIGLNNVISRLRMFYNKEDVIEITSVEESGAEVVIYIPT